MIIYNLVCEHEHAFEGWFKSEEDYKKQTQGQMLSCPTCESKQVRKIPTASYVVARNNTSVSSPKKLSSGEQQKLVRELASYLTSNTEDVGTRFAEEAKKMHYGETVERGIRGQATIEEVKGLNEEGIDVFPIPGQIIDKRKLN